MPELSIIILNYNTRALLEECLKSVFNFTVGITYEIIIVDNASHDDSLKFINTFITKNKSAHVKLIKNTDNFGFAKANNIGIKSAEGKYILLLNSDTLLEEDAFSRLLKLATEKSDFGIAGPKLLNADNSVQPSTAPFYTLLVTAFSLFRGDKYLRRSPEKQTQVDWISGSCFLINRKLIEKIGLLDEHFFMYIEEMEFCYRAHQAGFSVWFFPETSIYHLVRGSTPEGKQKVIWWIYEGLQYFYRKHFAGWQFSVLKWLLRSKAFLAMTYGFLTGNDYLKKTYAKALQLVG
jgi:GT2 family glycosyltransferase